MTYLLSLHGDEELQPSSTAQLGGLYVIDAESMEEACAWAANVPSAAFGTVEGRPLAGHEHHG